jgi:hypothetical protein
MLHRTTDLVRISAHLLYGALCAIVVFENQAFGIYRKGQMVKKRSRAKKASAWTGVRKNVAPPYGGSYVLRAKKSGRPILKSPVDSATTVTEWSRAFKK